MWDIKSIKEEIRVDSNAIQYYGADVGFIALFNAKGSFENGKFTLKILRESEKLCLSPLALELSQSWKGLKAV